MNQIVATVAAIWFLGLGLAIIAGQGKIGKWYARKSKKLLGRLAEFLLRLPVSTFKWCWKKNRLITAIVSIVIATSAVIGFLNCLTTFPQN